VIEQYRVSSRLSTLRALQRIIVTEGIGEQYDAPSPGYAAPYGGVTLLSDCTSAKLTGAAQISMITPP
jgi:hypothetical protein